MLTGSFCYRHYSLGFIKLQLSWTSFYIYIYKIKLNSLQLVNNIFPLLHVTPFMAIDANAVFFMSVFFLYRTFQFIYEDANIYIICLPGNLSQSAYWVFSFLESFWLEFHLRKEDQKFLASL